MLKELIKASGSLSRHKQFIKSHIKAGSINVKNIAKNVKSIIEDEDFNVARAIADESLYGLTKADEIDVNSCRTKKSRADERGVLVIFDTEYLLEYEADKLGITDDMDDDDVKDALETYLTGYQSLRDDEINEYIQDLGEQFNFISKKDYEALESLGGGYEDAIHWSPRILVDSAEDIQYLGVNHNKGIVYARAFIEFNVYVILDGDTL